MGSAVVEYRYGLMAWRLSVRRAHAQRVKLRFYVPRVLSCGVD